MFVRACTHTFLAALSTNVISKIYLRPQLQASGLSARLEPQTFCQTLPLRRTK